MAAHHPHLPGPAGSRLRVACLLTIAVLGIEVGSGLAAHSLALLSDAGHLLTDVLALGLAWVATVRSARPPDERRTYGYHRVGILVAAANGALLVLVVAAVAVASVERLMHAQPVSGGTVMVAAAVAVLVNAYIRVTLGGDAADLNVRAALLHVTGDLIASLGVVLAGAVILATGWVAVDPLLSLGIAGLIAFSAVRVLLESVNILLEGAPRGVDISAVERAIAVTDGVTAVHDLHLWSLSSQDAALSCHLVVQPGSASDAEHLVREVEAMLCRQFGVGHATIQVETCHPCDDGHLSHQVGEHTHHHGELRRETAVLGGRPPGEGGAP